MVYEQERLRDTKFEANHQLTIARNKLINERSRIHGSNNAKNIKHSRSSPRPTKFTVTVQQRTLIPDKLAIKSKLAADSLAGRNQKIIKIAEPARRRFNESSRSYGLAYAS